MMERDIQTGSFVIAFALCDIEWCKLYVRDVAQANRDIPLCWLWRR